MQCKRSMAVRYRRGNDRGRETEAPLPPVPIFELYIEGLSDELSNA